MDAAIMDARRFLLEKIGAEDFMSYYGSRGFFVFLHERLQKFKDFSFPSIFTMITLYRNSEELDEFLDLFHLSKKDEFCCFPEQDVHTANGLLRLAKFSEKELAFALIRPIANDKIATFYNNLGDMLQDVSVLERGEFDRNNVDMGDSVVICKRGCDVCDYQIAQGQTKKKKVSPPDDDE